MPCQDYDTHHDAHRRWTEEEDKLKACLDERTKQLCEVLTQAELHDSFTLLGLSQETMDWWIRHKKQDRDAAERIKKRAEMRKKRGAARKKLRDFLKNMDPEERKLLGPNNTVINSLKD